MFLKMDLGYLALNLPIKYKMNKPLRIGFDLDGVLLYNPLRIGRMPVTYIKRKFFNERKTHFHIPHGKIEEGIWSILHLSSMFLVDGLSPIDTLIKQNKVEAYVVTARYNFLQPNTRFWFNRLRKKHNFKDLIANTDDQQPHLYKEKILNRLKLDIFVEDNWDIVDYLHPKVSTKIFWIYNIVDRNISYPTKFPSLKQATTAITTIVK